MNFSNVNIFDLIILLGAVQGILLAAFLFFRPKSNKKANSFLSLLILGFSLNSVFIALEGLGIRTGNITRAIEYVPLYCSLLIIAAFYFFVEYLIHPKRSFQKKDLLFFIPYFFQFGYQCFCLILTLIDKDYILNNFRGLLNIFDWIDLVAVVFGLAVLINAILKINRYENDILKNYSEVSNISLSWLKKLIFGLFAIWVLWTIPTIYEQVTHKPSLEIFYPMWIAMSGMIYWIGYSTYSKKELLEVQMFHKTVVEETKKKPEKSLSKKTTPYYKDLIKLMETEKLYLNSNLNLKTLAEKLDISSGYLSQIINQYEKKNFFEFVNTYRVNEVKQKINDPELSHLSLLGIAYESGFKSKSTVNLAFRQITGQTPSAFKKATS